MMEINGFLAEARAEFEKSREIYRQLHKCAEEGLQLPNTKNICREHLRAYGCEVFENRGGIYTVFGKGEECILLRADMDALPMAEESGVEYSSHNGCTHACGHDMHTAMLLSAARILKKREKELRCRVKLCFQAGEEILSGAKLMIEDGILNSPDVTEAVMLHVLTGTPHKTGTVMIPPADVGASGVDFFKVEVVGKGCHGSMIHTGTDPIVPACQMITALSSLVGREVKGGDGDVLTVGRITAGESANAIPEKAVFYGTLRSYIDTNREYLKERLKTICSCTAETHKCRAEVDFFSGAPSFINNADVRSFAIDTLSESGFSLFCVPEGQRGGGSEDFAYVSRLVPSLMLCISAGSAEEGYTEPLHSPRVRFNEEAISYGAAVYAALAFGKGIKFNRMCHTERGE